MDTPSNLREFAISASELIALADSLKIPHVVLRDSIFYYVSLTDWQRVISACREAMPEYLPERRDCENIAAIMSSRVSARFALNSCGIAILARLAHAVNLFIAEQDGAVALFYLEAQTGKVIPFVNTEWNVETWEIS